MDYFIQITFVLLILSMIAEKVTNFIKLNYPDNAIKRFFNKEPKLSHQATIEEFEDVHRDKKTREVQTLAILVSITLAFGCRANLFQIYDPNFELGWINIDWSSYSVLDGVSDFFGCGLTGIFLSLGSKFFHDLLGLLLESRNLKKKLKNRDEVTAFGEIEAVDEYIEKVEPVFIEKQVEEKVKAIPGIKSFEYSAIDKTVDVYMHEVTDDEFKKLQKFIEVKLAGNDIKGIELNYIFL